MTANFNRKKLSTEVRSTNPIQGMKKKDSTPMSKIIIDLAEESKKLGLTES